MSLRKIYWRLRADVRDGSVAWEPAWIVGFPADGLIEIGNDPQALCGKVLSIDEIEYKDVK